MLITTVVVVGASLFLLLEMGVVAACMLSAQRSHEEEKL